MKRFTGLRTLILLLVVWPAYGQTLTAPDYVNQGNVLYQQGDYDGAITKYTKAIGIDASFAPAYYNRGLARKTKEDLDGAISDYTKAISFDPRLGQAYVNRGNARKAKGDLDGAIADYNSCIGIDSRIAPAYYNRGSAQGAKGDIDGAIADYTKATEIDPNYALASNDLAWLLSTAFRNQIRDGNRAVDYARKAAELTRWENAAILDTLAAAYAETGNFNEAIKWEEKALSVPEFVKHSGEQARKRLQLYTERKPYHQPAPK